MAGRIAQILGQKNKETPERAAALERLAALAEQHADLRGPANLQAALLRAMYVVPAPVTLPAISADDAAAQLGGGVPLLHDLPLPFTGNDLRAAFERLCQAAERAPGVERATADAAKALRRADLDVWALAQALLRGEGADLLAALEERNLPAPQAATLLRFAMLPFLEQVATALAPLRAEMSWKHGYCPACGAWPVMAEQRGLEQQRYLRCGLCASSWEADRLWCPFCDNRNHLGLNYLHVEGEEQRQRVFTCDMCRCYLKVRTSLTPLSTPDLLVEEVALLHLDMVALHNNYAPPV